MFSKSCSILVRSSLTAGVKSAGSIELNFGSFSGWSNGFSIRVSVDTMARGIRPKRAGRVGTCNWVSTIADCRVGRPLSTRFSGSMRGQVKRIFQRLPRRPGATRKLNLPERDKTDEQVRRPSSMLSAAETRHQRLSHLVRYWQCHFGPFQVFTRVIWVALSPFYSFSCSKVLRNHSTHPCCYCF